MDNFHIEMVSEGEETFSKALDLVFEHVPGKKTIGYKIVPGKETEDEIETESMVLYWYKSEGTVLFPYEMNSKQAKSFVWGWLENADYGVEPDHDGDNHHGWKMSNDFWGHVDGDSRAFIKIQPIWSMYGK